MSTVLCQLWYDHKTAVHVAELEAENTALANSLVAHVARPQQAPATAPAAGADGRLARAATALRKPATGSQSGTLAELPALTNAAGVLPEAHAVDAPLPAAVSPEKGNQSAALAGPAEARKGDRGKQQHTQPGGVADTQEEAAKAPPASVGGNDGDGGGRNTATAEQPYDEAVSAPCASSAGKRKRMAGPQKHVRKAARGEGRSSSPGQQRKQKPAAAAAAGRGESPALEQRAQKDRILDLSHIQSFAHTARGAMDQLRGAGPRRRTADVTLKSRAVRTFCACGYGRILSKGQKALHITRHTNQCGATPF